MNDLEDFNMFEFLASVTITIISSSPEVPKVNTNILDIARTGEQIAIVRISPDAHQTAQISFKSVIIERSDILSEQEQKEVNYLCYLK